MNWEFDRNVVTNEIEGVFSRDSFATLSIRKVAGNYYLTVFGLEQIAKCKKLQAENFDQAKIESCKLVVNQLQPLVNDLNSIAYPTVDTWKEV